MIEGAPIRLTGVNRANRTETLSSCQRGLALGVIIFQVFPGEKCPTFLFQLLAQNSGNRYLLCPILPGVIGPKHSRYRNFFNVKIQLLIRCLCFAGGDKKLSISFKKEGLDKNNFSKIFTKK